MPSDKQGDPDELYIYIYINRNENCLVDFIFYYVLKVVLK